MPRVASAPRAGRARTVSSVRRELRVRSPAAVARVRTSWYATTGGSSSIPGTRIAAWNGCSPANRTGGTVSTRAEVAAATGLSSRDLYQAALAARR